MVSQILFLFFIYLFLYSSIFLDYETEPCRFPCLRVWPDDQPSSSSASPDAISFCQCHCNGCVEIKCYFCIKDTSISEAVKKGVSVCLEQSTDRLKRKRNHAYWYQVQLQLAISEFTHADFVVWTTQDMHIERIEGDHLFFESQLKVANEFYISGILPELLAK